MFRLFLKLNILGKVLSELLLLIFFVCLFFPLIPALGIFNPVNNGLTQEHFLSLISKVHLSIIIEALTYSFITGYFCTLLGFFIGFLTHHNFTGKFLFLSLLSFFLFIPESLQLMVASPVLGFIFKTKGSLVDITYLSSFLFLTTISILSTYALMAKVSKAELEILSNLGASPIQIFTKFIFPLGKKMAIYLGFTLSIQVLFYGTHTQFIANPDKHVLTWNLSGPYFLYNDFGLSSATYSLLLVLFLISLLPTFLFINKEFHKQNIKNSSKSNTKNKKSTRKKVTRKLPKKKKVATEIAEKELPPDKSIPEKSNLEDKK